MISKTADARIYKLDDLKLLKSIHERAATLQRRYFRNDTDYFKRKKRPHLYQLYKISKRYKRKKKKMGVTLRFMLKLEMLAQLNEAIIHQNSTLITQNRLKDEKLDELMQQVYVKEGSQEKMLQELVDHAAQTDALQKEKMDLLMNHML